jgi:hypothetical protein
VRVHANHGADEPRGGRGGARRGRRDRGGD